VITRTAGRRRPERAGRSGSHRCRPASRSS
jgi:hypothetical protein